MPKRTASAAAQGVLGLLQRSQETDMLRKLIMLAITSGVAKKLYDNYREKHMQTPFPTAERPPEGPAKRGRKTRSTA